MEIPSPIEWKDVSNDLIKDGSGDASVGTCGTGQGGRDGSDGFDSHTTILSNNKGSAFDPSLVGTEDGDSLARPSLWNETGICNQFIGSRIYGVVNFKYNTPTLIAQKAAITLPVVTPICVSGNFYIPSSPILNGTYTKTFQARTGGDRGNVINDLWSRTIDADFEPKLNADDENSIQVLNTWFFSFSGDHVESLVFVGLPVNGTIEVVGGDDITSLDYTSRSLNDRRVFIKIWDQAVNGYLLYDTDLLLGDYLDGGILFSIAVTQTSIVGIVGDDNKFTIGTTVQYEIPESQFNLTKTVTSEYNRCQNGEVRLKSFGNIKRVYALPVSGQFAYTGGAFNLGWRLAGHDPQWWINDINDGAARSSDDQKYLFLLPWINDFRVTDGTFSDTAAFLIASFKHLDSSGVLKLAKYASDYDSYTIPDGTEINIGEVETGDTFTIGLDNEGEVTTEVTSITFDTPFISTVDDSTPTLLPYDYQTVAFTTSAATTGSSDIVITHDKNNLLIPSPWTLTLTTQSGPVDGGGPGAGGI